MLTDPEIWRTRRSSGNARPRPTRSRRLRIGIWLSNALESVIKTHMRMRTEPVRWADFRPETVSCTRALKSTCGIVTNADRHRSLHAWQRARSARAKAINSLEPHCPACQVFQLRKDSALGLAARCQRRNPSLPSKTARLQCAGRLHAWMCCF